jgi:hypothetical protein
VAGEAIDAKMPRFAIFRAKDAIGAADMTCMTYEPVSPMVAAATQKALAAGANAGSELKLLFAIPGFSLAYVWFKSDFPLPRHCHNVDCLYYILGGSLNVGQEELGAGDGFFVGRDVPYTYKAGSAGVEVLEFRAADVFNIKLLANNPAFWDMAIETVRSRQSEWEHEPRPAEVMRRSSAAVNR